METQAEIVILPRKLLLAVVAVVHHKEALQQMVALVEVAEELVALKAMEHQVKDKRVALQMVLVEEAVVVTLS
jgi:hypothetical protein